MIRCIAVDDEPLALGLIEEYIDRMPGLTLMATFTDSRQVPGFMREHGADIVFLDVEMPGISGIELARTLEGQCAVILTTAYPQYALDGFELNVTDYLLKPIPFDRFERAVQKALAERRLAANSQHIPQGGANESESQQSQTATHYIFVKTDQRIKKIELDTIYYIEGMKDYISIYTEQERVVTLQLMRKMEAHLPADRFMRVHRSYIVALPKITQIERNRIWIGEHVIPIGETYREAFFKKNLKHRI